MEQTHLLPETVAEACDSQPPERQGGCSSAATWLGERFQCPYCLERDFDAAGLKGHLEHKDCDEYRTTEQHERLFA